MRNLPALKQFLYILMRDEVVPGKIERIITEHLEKAIGKDLEYSNEDLAHYAEKLVDKIAELSGIKDHWPIFSVPPSDIGFVESSVRYELGTDESRIGDSNA